MPVHAASQLPGNVREVLRRVPELAERILGLPQLSLADLSHLEGFLLETYSYIDGSLPASLGVLEALAKQPSIALGLARLVAFACRMEVNGIDNGREHRLHTLACKAVLMVGAELFAVNSEIVGYPAASRAAKDIAVDLAWSILKGQNLQAAAKQVAAAAAVLASPEQQAGLSAGGLGRFRLRAGQVAHRVIFLLRMMSIVARSQGGRALTAALLTALRESRLLEHTGRLLLLLPHGPGEEPASEELAEFQRSAHHNLCRMVHGLRAVCNLAGRSPDLELPSLLGPCGLHALLALGASTLAAADGGPCGLPRDPLLGTAPVSEGRSPCVEGECVEALMLALADAQQGPAPLLSPRARIRLLVRVLQLAGASAEATRFVTVLGPERRLQVRLSWSGGRRQHYSQEFARLLPPASMGGVAAAAVQGLLAPSTTSVPAWAAEAPAFLEPLFTCVRHCLNARLGGADAAKVAGAVPGLLTGVAKPLLAADGCAMTPAALPAVTAVALEGGVVPLLETLLRAAGDSPAGPEAQMTAAMLSEEAGRSLFALLVHSPPRQAAAFLATLAKLLRRTPPAALLEPLPPKGGPLPPGACVLLTDCILSRLLACVHSERNAGAEPPGPVDPSAPCSPLFVLSLAALQLLPVVSRLTREAAQLAGTGLPSVGFPVDLRAGSSSAGGSRQGAGPATESQHGPMSVRLLWTQLAVAVLLEALRQMVVLGGGCPAAPTRLSTALCLPFLVEEAGAVPLLGALLAALQRDGELPGQRPTPQDLLVQVAQCCVGLAGAYPKRVRGEGGSGSSDAGCSSGAGGSSGPPASASAAWSPAALRLLASRLRGSGPQLSEEVEALAARLEQPPPTAGAPHEGSPIAAELAAAAERLAALRAEVRAVLPPACSSPACVSLAGDSEAGLRLQQCGRCGLASYCCRECQVAHWRAGHKEACGGGGGGSKTG